jgi:hypothetical protein
MRQLSNVSTPLFAERSKCIVRVPECKGLPEFASPEERLNCFVHEIENMVVDRPVSLISASTPFGWNGWPFYHGIVALIMNASTVKVPPPPLPARPRVWPPPSPAPTPPLPSPPSGGWWMGG